jgi:hypothetical protein
MHARRCLPPSRCLSSSPCPLSVSNSGAASAPWPRDAEPSALALRGMRSALHFVAWLMRSSMGELSMEGRLHGALMAAGPGDGALL